jgi:hypothetical protein
MHEILASGTPERMITEELNAVCSAVQPCSDVSERLISLVYVAAADFPVLCLVASRLY